MRKSPKIKVVIPTDFSVQANFAYIMVKNLAKKSDMEVTFLHVLGVPDTVTMDAEGNIKTCGDTDLDSIKIKKNIASQKLADLKKEHGDEVNTALVLGKTTSGIIKFSEENSFDLIALGNKGTSGIVERIAGSEAQIIARRSSIPVLTLMCDRTDLELNNILLVHDFSEHGPQNLQLLKLFVQVFKTKLHLLQISYKEQEKDQILANMKTFAENNGLSKYTSHVIQDTNVESGVTHFNQMYDMDIVCIGTHGRGGVLRHSATETLINHLYKPVVSFKIQ
jgi:nucleotide-binding universal stress UspA family protein